MSQPLIKSVVVSLLVFNFWSCTPKPIDLTQPSATIHVPEFFRSPRSKNEIARLCEQSWGTSTAELPLEDRERVRLTKVKVIDDAWENYRRVVHGISQERIVTFREFLKVASVVPEKRLTIYELYWDITPNDLPDQKVDYFVKLDPFRSFGRGLAIMPSYYFLDEMRSLPYSL